MSVMTNYYERAVLNAARGITTTAPATVYVALFQSDPTETGVAGVELTYQDYVRQELILSAPTTSGNEVKVDNLNLITFPLPDTSGMVVTHAAVMDSQVGGNMLIHTPLVEPIKLTTETSPRFAIGEIIFTLAAGNMDVTYKPKVFNLLRGINLDGFTPYFAMYNGDPANGGGELSGTDYARLPLEFDEPAEQVSGQMQIANANAAESKRALTPWGTWTHGVIMTAETGGSRWFYKANKGEYPMKNGAQAYLIPGSIKVAVN